MTRLHHNGLYWYRRLLGRGKFFVVSSIYCHDVNALEEGGYETLKTLLELKLLSRYNHVDKT